VLHARQIQRLVYLPDGTWYDFWTSTQHVGGTMLHVDAPLETVPLFVRAGAILPMWPEMHYIGARPVDTVTFAIYPDTAGAASTTLYEDDGVSPAYQQGVCRRTTVRLQKAGSGFDLCVSAPAGSFQPAARDFVFVVNTATATGVQLDGRPLSVMPADEKRTGWQRLANGISVRLTDDGKAHQIQVR
jgi:alpha-glucosidase (family GH31 glycosyl hydrolase)